MALDQFRAFLERSFSQLMAKRPQDCVFSMVARGEEETLNEEIRPYGFVDVNEELAHGIRMLHLACYHGHDSVVRLLLRRGATDSRAGAHPYRFWTALHFAVCAGSLECVRALKPTFEKMQRRDTFNITCIHIASHHGHVALIDEMLQLAPNEHARYKMLNEEGHVRGDDAFGSTPLDEACAGGQWDCVRYLISRGATYMHTDRVSRNLVEASPLGDPTENDKQLASTKRARLDSSADSPSPEGSRKQDDRRQAQQHEDSPSLWQRRFEDLAKLAIASGVDQDQVMPPCCTFL